MPKKFPPEFRRDVVAVARRGQLCVKSARRNPRPFAGLARRLAAVAVLPVDTVAAETGDARMLGEVVNGGCRLRPRTPAAERRRVDAGHRCQPTATDHFLELEDGELRYRAQRKLGGVWLAHSDRDLEQVTGPLGLDALRVSSARFVELLAAKRGGIKSALMNQETIAGLGNITTGRDPLAGPDRPTAEGARCRRAEPRADRAEDEGRPTEVRGPGPGAPTSSSWLTSERDNDDPTCPRCGTDLETSTVNGRTSYVCPECRE